MPRHACGFSVKSTCFECTTFKFCDEKLAPQEISDLRIEEEKVYKWEAKANFESELLLSHPLPPRGLLAWPPTVIPFPVKQEVDLEDDSPSPRFTNQISFWQVYN